MKEEILKIIEQERINPEKKYNKPFLILLTGEVGSGKSLVAELLSQALNLYLINGDYVRNIVKSLNPNIEITTPEVRKVINEVCLDEMSYCERNNYSIILDRSVSNYEDLNYIKNKHNLPIVFIRLLSNDLENIKRVEERPNKKNNPIPHYGHQETTSGVVTKQEYNKIKETKVYNLEDCIYDYFLNTTTTIEELKENLENIIINIKNKYN